MGQERADFAGVHGGVVMGLGQGPGTCLHFMQQAEL